MTEPRDTDLVDRIYASVQGTAATATAPHVTVGERVVLVELTHPDHGHLAGVAHRPRGERPESWPENVSALASLATDGDTDGKLRRAVGIATLNALSAPEVEWQSGDPMASLDDAVATIATVGLFRPAFRKFSAVDVRVVEREPPDSVTSPDDVTVDLFPPDECETAFAGADVCFITGSTLVYGGLDRYLSALRSADVPLVVLVGATASFVPGPAFDAGIDLVAGARVRNPAGVRASVRAGDCGTDLHDSGLEKVYVARSSELPGLSLDAGKLDETSERSSETGQTEP